MSEIQVNTINEYTSANGVNIDGALIKDNFLAATAGGGLVKLFSQTASGDSYIAFNTIQDNTNYSRYMVTIQDLIPSSDGATLRAIFKNGSSDITGSYHRAHESLGLTYSGNSHGTDNTHTDYTEIAFGLGNDTGESWNGEIIISFGGGSYYATMHSQAVRQRSSGSLEAQQVYGGIRNTSATGVKFVPSAGNFTSGVFTVYGYRK